jgi:hypothetical protein
MSTELDPYRRQVVSAALDRYRRRHAASIERAYATMTDTERARLSAIARQWEADTAAAIEKAHAAIARANAHAERVEQ